MEDLIAAASGPDLAAVIDATGRDAVADLVTDEIVFRAALWELTPLAEPIVLTLAFDGGTRARTISIGRDVTVSTAQPPATVLVSQELTDVVRALFGSGTSPTRSVTWPLLWPDFDSLAPKRYPPRAVFEAARRVVDALDRHDDGLAALAVRYRTDKWGLHQYTACYAAHFAELRREPVRLLEIGVGGQAEPDVGGESLKMWKHYFPRGIIRGIDIEDKRHFAEQRVHIDVVDQSDPARLRSYAAQAGPFDIVIDDGSHLSPDVITSFHSLFPFVRPGGWYVVEDVQTSYWDFDGGNSGDPNDPGTSMGFLKSLVDGLNHAEFLGGDRLGAAATDDQIRSIHFYHNIVFIEKAANRDGSPIARALETVATPAEHAR